MTIFATIRALSFLARDVYLAAANLLLGSGLPGYDHDNADELAEHEAREEVWMPEDDCGRGEAVGLSYGAGPAYLACPECGTPLQIQTSFRPSSASPPHPPVASASPQTPADATAKTLANDPQSVHERHMRRLLGEDKEG